MFGDPNVVPVVAEISVSVPRLTWIETGLNSTDWIGIRNSYSEEWKFYRDYWRELPTILRTHSILTCRQGRVRRGCCLLTKRRSYVPLCSIEITTPLQFPPNHPSLGLDPKLPTSDHFLLDKVRFRRPYPDEPPPHDLCPHGSDKCYSSLVPFLCLSQDPVFGSVEQ